MKVTSFRMTKTNIHTQTHASSENNISMGWSHRVLFSAEITEGSHCRHKDTLFYTWMKGQTRRSEGAVGQSDMEAR